MIFQILQKKCVSFAWNPCHELHQSNILNILHVLLRNQHGISLFWAIIFYKNCFPHLWLNFVPIWYKQCSLNVHINTNDAFIISKQIYCCQLLSLIHLPNSVDVSTEWIACAYVQSMWWLFCETVYWPVWNWQVLRLMIARLTHPANLDRMWIDDCQLIPSLGLNCQSL